MRSILRSAAFRRVAALSAAFCVAAFLLFAFIYWQTAVFETRRIDELVERQSTTLAHASAEEILWTVNTGIAHDLHRVTFAALFEPSGRLVAGNLAVMPAGLSIDGHPHWLRVARADAMRPDTEAVVAGRLLPDGRTLVIGRTLDQLAQIRAVVSRALELGVIPVVVLALGFGLLAGHRTNQRLKAVQVVLDRVRRGHLAERLPVGDSGSDFDQLAIGVNHMLGELERLLGELQDVGNNIAHDLRTPLARVRAQLERARRVCQTRDELAEVVDRAVLGLDQAAGIITALLRLAEIEQAQRGASFAPVDLAEVLREVSDLYGPIAEAKQITATLELTSRATVHGDRDLLFEAIANLVDNAIKFTPAGGRVDTVLRDTPAGPLVQVSDSGPGVPPEHRLKVFSRFHRVDKSRHVPGNGLGLSLVQAIARMHGFAATVHGRPGEGCVVRLLCAMAPPDPPPSAAASASQTASRRVTLQTRTA